MHVLEIWKSLDHHYNFPTFSTYPGHGSLESPVMSTIQVGEYPVLILQVAIVTLREKKTEEKVLFLHFLHLKYSQK